MELNKKNSNVENVTKNIFIKKDCWSTLPQNMVESHPMSVTYAREGLSIESN